MCPGWRSAAAIAASASLTGEHSVAGPLQRAAAHFAHLRVVLHQEDGLAHRRGLLRLRPRPLGARSKRGM